MWIGELRRRLNAQVLVTTAILLVVGFLVLLPVLFLVEESFNTGDPMAFPAETLGLDNYLAILDEDLHILTNTVIIAIMATAMAIAIGFTLAWILTRTNVPGRDKLERLMELPYYMTPLVGALAWSVLAGPKSGFFNQLWQWAGGRGDPFNIYSMFGIAWVMALFEGTVAFVMIAASMKSMDPALEESARVIGASKLRTTLTVTLPLVLPGVLGATLFVFAEMLGSFAAALVIGIPGRIYVITTSIWEATLSYPPDYGRAAAMGLSLFAVMFAMVSVYRWIVQRGSYATITGKAYRPRPMDMGRLAWLLFGVCATYIFLAVVLPLAALILTSLQRFATVLLDQAQFTLANYATALSLGPVRTALFNSLLLGLGVASVGVLVMAVLVWIIYRSQLVGRGAVEYLVMFPQAVPRMVFGLALLWAWLNMPVPLYGTLWLLALAYFTVMLPLGVRSLAGVVLQIDKSLEECARVCGAGWGYQMRTVTLPLLKPGILAAWLLIFMACVRELGASVFLMGPNAKVIAPSIVSAWASSGTELTAAMALIQTFTVVVALVILFRLTRGVTRELT
ncbi:iron ABC transporter permease [Vineibacter terrae]|uniref:Iron ABC transporter permease n=1 Tax=Vineibacter terrae TaxID=2586908 RepID=A0A5C8PBK0_9HYPH|nr:iron ABC transporter permease [Vineibacter terrae]TXL70941.1 iron ABC transporter permease [Vineibacter terrae]